MNGFYNNNKMFEKSLISIRNFCVRNFFVNIIGFKSHSKIIWLTSNNIFTKLINFLLLLVPLVITVKISHFFNHDVIYNYDKIFYISNTSSNKIIPVLLEFKAYCGSEPSYLYDLTYQIKYYNTSIPFNVFVTLNIPKIYDSIKLKYISKGILKEKHILINDYKNYLIYNLFDN